MRDENFEKLMRMRKSSAYISLDEDFGKLEDAIFQKQTEVISAMVPKLKTEINEYEHCFGMNLKGYSKKLNAIEQEYKLN